MALPFKPVALALGALLLAPAAGSAATTTSLTARLTTERPPTALAPAPGQVDVALTVTDDPGVPAYPQSRIRFDLPDGLTLDGTGFATCSVAQINEQGAGSCPAASQVGRGTATAELGPGRARVDFVLSVFNAGPGQVALELRQPDGSISFALPAVIDDAPEPGYGQRLTLDVPRNIQEPAPNLYAELTRFTLSLGARIRGGATFALATGCPATPYRATVTAAPGGALTATATGTCALGTLPPAVKPGHKPKPSCRPHKPRRAGEKHPSCRPER